MWEGLYNHCSKRGPFLLSSNVLDTKGEGVGARGYPSSPTVGTFLDFGY